MQVGEIYNKLNGICRDVFGDDSLVVTPQTTARDINGWDSLYNVRLLLTVERVVGVKFSAYEVNQLLNVGHLVDLLQTKLAVRSGKEPLVVIGFSNRSPKQARFGVPRLRRTLPTSRGSCCPSAVPADIN